MTDAITITLSLISHTNAGKTTLARTLLAQDVGDVRDAAHVTTEAAAYPLIVAATGAQMVLWDTPGFGDSARLARRLAGRANPIGWFLAEIWDRFRERPLWLAQQALHNVREQADVVLYLVNAAESPADAGYLASELQVLEWAGKPAIALLNQTGRPRPRAEEAADEGRWREALSSCAAIRRVLTLDAFARCWVQERVLLQAVRDVLPEARVATLDALESTWARRRIEQLDAAMRAIAQPIAGALGDEVRVPPGSGDALQGLRRMLRLGTGEQKRHAAAMRPLAERLDVAIRRSTDTLIAVYRLDGRAASEVTAALAEHVTREDAMSEGRAAMLGGVVSGALSGLAADIAAGGFTLGAGMLVGGLVGALGGAGVARGYNAVRGTRDTVLRWSDAFLDGLARGALLRYLAVAHHGRGRGPWTETPPPAFWREAIAKVVDARAERFSAVWRMRGDADSAAVTAALAAVLRECALDVLDALYPGAARDLDALVA